MVSTVYVRNSVETTELLWLGSTAETAELLGNCCDTKSVADKLSLTHDYLPVLKQTDDTYLRFLLLEPMFAKYADTPQVGKYYSEQFAADPESVY